MSPAHESKTQMFVYKVVPLKGKKELLALYHKETVEESDYKNHQKKDAEQRNLGIHCTNVNYN